MVRSAVRPVVGSVVGGPSARGYSPSGPGPAVVIAHVSSTSTQASPGSEVTPTAARLAAPFCKLLPLLHDQHERNLNAPEKALRNKRFGHVFLPLAKVFHFMLKFCAPHLFRHQFRFPIDRLRVSLLVL